MTFFEERRIRLNDMEITPENSHVVPRRVLDPDCHAIKSNRSSHFTL